jgi:hypothetical protein
MTDIPMGIGDVQSREWRLDHRTLVLSASGNRVLTTLNTRYPLLLSPVLGRLHDSSSR